MLGVQLNYIFLAVSKRIGAVVVALVEHGTHPVENGHKIVADYFYSRFGKTANVGFIRLDVFLNPLLRRRF